MARTWELNGPEKDRLTVKEVAELFGYEVKTWRQLVRAGYALAPRGFGQGQFYTGLDVAVLLEVMGRWRPQDGPEEAEDDPAANVPKVPKTGRKRPESAEESDS